MTNRTVQITTCKLKCFTLDIWSRLWSSEWFNKQKKDILLDFAWSQTRSVVSLNPSMPKQALLGLWARTWTVSGHLYCVSVVSGSQIIFPRKKFSFTLRNSFWTVDLMSHICAWSFAKWYYTLILLWFGKKWCKDKVREHNVTVPSIRAEPRGQTQKYTGVGRK